MRLHLFVMKILITRRLPCQLPCHQLPLDYRVEIFTMKYTNLNKILLISMFQVNDNLRNFKILNKFLKDTHYALFVFHRTMCFLLYCINYINR